MALALSSAAAPRASLDELVAGAVRRGLFGLHLVEGDAHGIRLDMPRADLQHAVALLSAAGARVVAIETDSADSIAPQMIADTCRQLGGCLLVNGSRARDAAGAEHLALELNAARENVADAAAAIFQPGAMHVAHITLRGGGPEAAQHEGRGIGTLMTRLALSGIDLPIVLAPSSRAVLPVWRAWLHHGKKWGCGSKTADDSLVQLG